MHRVERDGTIRMLQRHPFNWKMISFLCLLWVPGFEGNSFTPPEATADLCRPQLNWQPIGMIGLQSVRFPVAFTGAVGPRGGRHSVTPA